MPSLDLTRIQIAIRPCGEERVIVFGRSKGAALEGELGVLVVGPGEGVDLALLLLDHPAELELVPRSPSVTDFIAIGGGRGT